MARASSRSPTFRADDDCPGVEKVSLKEVVMEAIGALFREYAPVSFQNLLFGW
jgi:hypothetical protein